MGRDPVTVEVKVDRGSERKVRVSVVAVVIRAAYGSTFDIESLELVPMSFHANPDLDQLCWSECDRLRYITTIRYPNLPVSLNRLFHPITLSPLVPVQEPCLSSTHSSFSPCSRSAFSG